jgi:hypothetical protein
VSASVWPRLHQLEHRSPAELHARGVRVLHDRLPRVLAIDDFATAAECEHIMAAARPRLAPSGVVDDMTLDGETVESAPEMRALLFAQYDGDGSGVLDGRELVDYVAAEAQLDDTELLLRDAQSLLRRVHADADRDGRVSRAEFMDARESRCEVADERHEWWVCSLTLRQQLAQARVDVLGGHE